MGSILAIFLGSVVGVILIVTLGFLAVRNKFKKFLGDSDFNLLKEQLKNGDYETEEDSYSKDKSIGGMTNIYEPQIRADFPDFNLSLLFNNIEKNLRSILNAKTNKDKSLLNDDQLVLVRNNVLKEIEDMKYNNIDVTYKDISFKQHVIKHYSKKNGTATITTASQVSYYYDSNKKDKKISGIKKSTIYICDFIYVYDESKFKAEQKVLSINCRNCGAPLIGLDGGTCDYCGTYSKAINLKAWKIASYKEDKRN